MSCVVGSLKDKGSSNLVVRPTDNQTLHLHACFLCAVVRYEEAERIEEMLKSGALEQSVSEKEAVAAAA